MNQIIASVLGKKRLFFKVPLFLMFPVAMVIEKFSKNPLITPDQLKMLQLDNVCEQKAAEKMFKRKFARLEDALGTYLA
ncbi:hypothetical protein HYU06_06955 [Candidatus Woesearchaeota archaeon]|nr:hypothetical protein [Candidatus Woesearchaeota archaeon]